MLFLFFTGAGLAAAEDDPCADAAISVWRILAGNYGGRDIDPTAWAEREPATGDDVDALLAALDDPGVRFLHASQADALLRLDGRTLEAL